VNLSNVSTGQWVTVTLNNVTDMAGNRGNVISPQMGVLIGDVDASGRVDSGDVSSAKQQAGQSVTASNFREDVNTDGLINSADSSLVSVKSGTTLP
jgi:hypothetical protein